VELKEYHSRYAYMTQQLDRINAEIQLRVGELQQLRESMKTLSNSKNIYQNIEQKLVDNLAQMEGLILVLD
jgi:soluble cytochrome b562